MRARWNYLLFRNILQLLPLQMAIAQKKVIVGEISVLVLGRCHFMNPSLHFICVTFCMKRSTGCRLARLIFYAVKYKIWSLFATSGEFFLPRRITCIRENAISCRVHYGKKWPAGTHCSCKILNKKGKNVRL